MRLLTIVFFMSVVFHAKSQSKEFEVKLGVYVDGQLYDPKANLMINKNTRFEIKLMSADLSENIFLMIFLVKDQKILNQSKFENYIEFNKNFNNAFFNSSKKDSQVYFCFIKKDLTKHSIDCNIAFSKVQCDKLIMIPFNKK